MLRMRGHAPIPLKGPKRPTEAAPRPRPQKKAARDSWSFILVFCLALNYSLTVVTNNLHPLKRDLSSHKDMTLPSGFPLRKQMIGAEVVPRDPFFPTSSGQQNSRVSARRLAPQKKEHMSQPPLLRTVT